MLKDANLTKLFSGLIILITISPNKLGITINAGKTRRDATNSEILRQRSIIMIIMTYVKATSFIPLKESSKRSILINLSRILYASLNFL